jgi:putative transposase
LGQIPRENRQELIDPACETLSLRCQCELLQVNRSALYYTSKPAMVSDLDLINEILDIWGRCSFYGYRRMTKELQSLGYIVNRKRVSRLMRENGIQVIYPGPNTSRRNKLHKVYKYLLGGMIINRANQAWMIDITYLRLKEGFVYLAALIDVHSRYVVAWKISNTMEASFCVETLQLGLLHAKPAIVNSDQGSQFTSDDWVNYVNEQGIKISMTGKGRCLDNVYIERFWRSVKQEEFYLNEYASIMELRKAIGAYVEFYNHKRWHQALGYKTPAMVYFSVNEESPMGMWTSPADQPSPFGPHGQVGGNALALSMT